MTRRKTGKATCASVEQFLASSRSDKRWRGGQPCMTCSHAEAKKINDELRVFAKAKAEGHQMPWSRFFQDRIKPIYKLRVVDTAIRRHVIECLGIR